MSFVLERSSILVVLRLAASCLLASVPCLTVAQTSSLVALSGDLLTYTPYANMGQANAVNTVPDFSHAGYRGGGVSLPDVPVAETLSPQAGDCRSTIQAAIDRVSLLPLDGDGFRGAVLLRAGRYEVSGPLFVRASGVVLRGKGQLPAGSGGTELVATSPTQHTFIQLIGNEAISVTSPVKRITNAYLPTGARSIEVDQSEGLSVGDTIQFVRTPNDMWINTLEMAQYGWTASSYEIEYERVIQAISGNVVTIDAPVVQAIEPLFGGGAVVRVSVKGRISRCGVENMMITSIYASDEDESHGWTAVSLTRTTDSWVRKVTARYFGYSCVSLVWAHHTTVEECAMLDPKSITTGSRKYSFYIDKGSFNLFQRCFTRGGRHDFVTGSRVAGPNVFVDCASNQTYADIGPHHRYATGVLFDNIRGGETRVQNRKDMGTGHGWAGAQTMFWNCRSDAGEFKVESPIGAMNWGIGCVGLLQSGAGFWEQWGVPVVPRSLYFQQLKERLGNAAMERVTLALQRQSAPIWPQLIQWAGIGDFAASTAVVDRGPAYPLTFQLSQNVPNPFNPSTVIGYQIPVASNVDLRVFDLLGREIAILANGQMDAGAYSARFDATGSASGVYVCRLVSRGEDGSIHREAIKLILQK